MIRQVGVRLVPDGALPSWLRPVVHGLEGKRFDELFAFPLPPGTAKRRSAVLMLLAMGPSGPDVLLTERAGTLRSHAGQPAFPGGRQDPGEDAVATALREGEEETGLDPRSVLPVALLPEMFLSPSSYLVAPVLAHWQQPGPVAPIDPAETALVARVPIADLVDPVNRGRVRHPQGYVGPAFRVADMLVWGFTAMLVDLVLRLGGWEQPWNAEQYFRLPSPERSDKPSGAPVLRDPEAAHLGPAP